MQFFKRSLFAILILIVTISFAQSETSWITKKKDGEKELKVEKKNSSNWIKKKEVKENKKKVKEKIKDSKSWITKKSKEKVKDIKNKLKKHKTIDQLPKAEFYFAAIIRPIEDGKETQYIYGYVRSNKKSELIEFNGKSFYSLSDGIAYFENKKNRCEVDSLLTQRRSGLSGDVIIKCKNNLKMTGGFVQVGSIGRGFGETSKGNLVEFEFFTSKKNAIAKLENYKNENLDNQFANQGSGSNEELNLEPQGKYYALLIGNSKYLNWASLTSPKNDISEIEKILNSKYNFEKVITVFDGTERKILKAFNELSKITTDNDYVLIYYSGHGDIVDGQSWWIPVDAEKQYGLGDWINISVIEQYMKKLIPAKHIALLVDSCYFAVSQKSNQNYTQEENLYSKYLKNRARIILVSGTNEPVDDTNQGKHSLFGYSFIQSLKNNNAAINLLKIRDELVLAHSNKRQTPYGHGMKNWGHNGGDFVFIAKKK